MSISSLDAAICIVYLVAMVVMGIWIGRDQRDLSGYLLGGRNLPWWAILGSIVATETSTATFLSVPGIAFAKDGNMTFLQLTFGYMIGRVLVAWILVPLYFRGQIYTAYEVLNERFGGIVKRTASLLFLVTRNLGDGLRLFLAGLALEQAVGLPLDGCILVIGIATIVYTLVGGMKAVIWSDCLQLVIYMIGGVLSLVILCRYLPGGWSELVEFGQQTDRFRWFDSGISEGGITIFSTPFNIWAGILGGAALTLGTHGTDQMFVQRYLCSRSQADACRAVIASGVVVFLQFALFLLIGIALACFYDRVDPTEFEHNDEVFASFVVNHLPVGMVGLTLAAIFAAAMSTLSSSLNSSAAAAVGDFYLPSKLNGGEAGGSNGEGQGNQETQQQSLKLSRLFTVVFGIIQIGIGMAASRISRSVVSDALAIAGFAAGLLLGVFALGIFDSRSHQRGVLVGFLGGTAALLYVKFQTDIAWPWYAIIGAATTYIIGTVASRAISPDAQTTNTEG